jgi:hypothetical protein
MLGVMLKRFDFESYQQWLPTPTIAFHEAAVATTRPAALPEPLVVSTLPIWSS